MKVLTHKGGFRCNMHTVLWSPVGAPAGVPGPRRNADECDAGWFAPVATRRRPIFVGLWPTSPWLAVLFRGDTARSPLSPYRALGRLGPPPATPWGGVGTCGVASWVGRAGPVVTWRDRLRRRGPPRRVEPRCPRGRPGMAGRRARSLG